LKRAYGLKLKGKSIFWIRDNLWLFQTPTTRKDVQYRVVECDGSDKKLVELVMEKLEEYTAPTKVIVTAMGVDRVEALAAALNRAPYHREAKDKSKSLRGMFKGESRLVVVATKALGLGIDLSDVRCQRSCG